jgi:signal transduction histidine kinase
VRVVEEFDPFAGTSKEPTAREFSVVGLNVFARKPRRARSGDSVADLEAENLRLREENARLSSDIDARSRECEVKNVRLEAMVKKLSVIQTQLVMQEKMASLGNLVAGVAHEINSPIGAVVSAADSNMRCMNKFRAFIAEHGSPPFPAECDRLLGVLDGNSAVIAEASVRITNIVRSLKMFARLDEAEYQKADIHEGIESTLTLLEHETRGRVTITRDFEALPPVTCYPSQLNQVFMNLLTNASQAIQKGDGKIHIATRRKDDDVAISITDNGIGIEATDIDKVFDPGFTTKGVGVGTGLGLSITHNIIRKHHGDITVTSSPGKGTTFVITLPISGVPGSNNGNT